MERVADYIIEKLVENGIKHVFLLTGRGVLYLTDAVAKNEKIEGISAYHEQSISYAAMAYAAATGGMAACLVSTGCAATNAVTAALCAYQDNLPIIFISGQNMLNETTRYTKIPIRTFGSQEADIVSIVQSVTKYSTMLTDVDSVGFEIDKAIYVAKEGRKGPVWIDIPLDIQNAKVNREELIDFVPPTNRKNLDKAKMQELTELYCDSKRPIFFIGGGVRTSNAVNEFAEVVNKLKIPVVYTSTAADAYGSGNKFSIGAVGSLGGSRAGNFAVQNADLIIAVGTKLCSQSIGVASEFGRAAKIVVVDIDKNEHSKGGASIDLFINSDAKVFLNCLLELKWTKNNSKWIDKCVHWKQIFDVSREEFIQKELDNGKIDLYYFADVLSKKLPNDATVITDAGFEELIIPSTIKFHDNQRCLFPAAQGAMGYAIPAIIGTFYAGVNNIVAVVGDGSFMMNMQELLAIGNRKIPAKIFVINNNMYAVIRKRQKDLFRTRTIGNDSSDGLESPDFRKIADCFNIDYCIIRSASELEEGIQMTLDADRPIICEVQCEEEQKYMHISYGFNERKKMVKRPLEDLAPFLDRNIIKDEMIIEPINL